MAEKRKLEQDDVFLFDIPSEEDYRNQCRLIYSSLEECIIPSNGLIQTVPAITTVIGPITTTEKKTTSDSGSSKLVELLSGSSASAAAAASQEINLESIRSMISQPLLYCANTSSQPVQNQNYSILEYSYYVRPSGWIDIFHNTYNILTRISNLVNETEIRYQAASLPYKKDVFNAFHATSLENVRVVLIGQDPYPGFCNGHPEAQGLSFSASRVATIPASLRNIFKELERSIPGFIMPQHGDLTRWTQQGILLLNTCLTFQPGIPKNSKEQKSYWEIWLPFTSAVLNVLSEKKPNTVYILLGGPAQKIEQYINEKSYKAKAPHPSPMNCGTNRMPFIGSNVFANVNRYLVENLKENPIDWNVD